MRRYVQALVRSGLLAAALSLALVAQALAVDVAIGGDVPANGSWAHYGTTRCTTASSRPLLKVTDPPDNGTLHAYVRDPSTGNRLGPIVSIHQTNTNFNQLGPLGSGQCFRLSARKDGFFGSGVVHWTGLLRY